MGGEAGVALHERCPFPALRAETSAPHPTLPQAGGQSPLALGPGSFTVMAALVAAIHVFLRFRWKTWMAGTRPLAGPAMTVNKDFPSHAITAAQAERGLRRAPPERRFFSISSDQRLLFVGAGALVGDPVDFHLGVRIVPQEAAKIRGA